MIREFLSRWMGRKRRTGDPVISIVDYEVFTQLEDQAEERQREEALTLSEQLNRQLLPAREDPYAVWRRFDDALRQVMRRHRRAVGAHGRVDFYHGEDWFHVFYDGFAVRTAKALTIPLLHDLQAVVAQHHPNAVLSFVGEASTPMLGLHVLVTATNIFAAWKGLSATDCRIKMSQTKVRIL